MELLLVVIALGTSVWVFADSSAPNWRKPHFTTSGFLWFLGSVLLWPVVFPVYLVVCRRQVTSAKP